MDCEFEEKEFENPLNHELLCGDQRIWTPGQVFEKHMGIDSALLVNSPIFWRQIGYSSPLMGAILNDYNFGYLWKRLKKTRTLPTFETNLFIQVKRPECLMRSNYDINMISPYYRYSIKLHQQEALSRLAKKLKHKGLVLYASPAFHTHKKLFQVINNQEIVAHTNFVNIDLLDGHEKWNYKYAGCSGVAHSEPEFVQMPSFDEQISKLLLMHREFHPYSNGSIDNDLEFLSNVVYEVADETRDFSPISVEYLNRFQEPDEGIIDDLYIGRLFINVLSFCSLFGLSWNVLFPSDSTDY